MEAVAIASPRVPGIPYRTRLPAMLLILASSGFVILVVFVATMVLPHFPRGLGEMTPHQMTSFRAQYIVFHIVAVATSTSGMAGLALLAAVLRHTRARTWASLALVVALASLCLGVVLVIARLSLLRFDDATLGQSSTWRWTTWAFSYLSNPTLAVATLAAGVALFQSGTLRRVGLSVALLSTVVLILTIVDFPPAVFVLLWLPLGVGLLRQRMPAAQPR